MGEPSIDSLLSLCYYSTIWEKETSGFDGWMNLTCFFFFYQSGTSEEFTANKGGDGFFDKCCSFVNESNCRLSITKQWKQMNAWARDGQIHRPSRYYTLIFRKIVEKFANKKNVDTKNLKILTATEDTQLIRTINFNTRKIVNLRENCTKNIKTNKANNLSNTKSQENSHNSN